MASRLAQWVALVGCLWLLSAPGQLARASGETRGSNPGGQIVSVGHDAVLPPGGQAKDIVSVFGSAVARGYVSQSVVAVFGDVRITGNVASNTVAVFGNSHIDGEVRGNVVDVVGNITLGPRAVIGGRVVNVLGTITRHAGSTVAGGVERVLSLPMTGVSWLPHWLQRCLIYGRLLAIAPDVAWAWGLALTALGLYILLAALFGNAVGHCARTLEAYPGRSILTALIAILLSPAIYLALLITVVGIVLLPFVWVGFFVIGVFGKAVALAWLGRRCRPATHATGTAGVVLDVLLGGLILLLLYLIPVVGFAAFTVFGLLGFGAVLYTLILASNLPRAGAAPAGEFFAHGRMPPDAQPAPDSRSGHDDTAHGEPSRHDATSASQPNLDETTLPRAGFWIRITALLIDALLVAILLGVLHDALRLELIFLAAYGAVMWKIKGTTIGGIICDLKVVRLDGRPLDWGTTIIRALGCFLSLVVAGLGFLWIALDPQHQAWHDKIAGTIVVRVPRGTPLV